MTRRTRPAAQATLAYLLPGLGQFLTGQTDTGVKALLLALVTWALLLHVLQAGLSPVTPLALAAVMLVHVGAGQTAVTGAARLGSAAAERRARDAQRRWSTLASAGLVATLLALFLVWAIRLPGWEEVRRNLPFLLMGRLRAEEFDPVRWRLWGLALPFAMGGLAFGVGRLLRRPVWLPAGLTLTGLFGGLALLWPLLVPETVLGGLALSLVLTLLAVTLAAPLGLLAGILRVSTLPVLRLIATGYIDLFRAVPLIVWVFGAFLLLPYVLGEGTGFLSVVLALAAFTGAYLGEIVRAGIQGLPAGQAEAARSLGLSGTQTLTAVVLPQALRRMVPPLAGQVITLFKDTSLVGIIGLLDLAGAGRITGNRLVTATFEIYLTVAALYFLFAFLLERVSLRLERAPGTRPGGASRP